MKHDEDPPIGAPPQRELPLVRGAICIEIPVEQIHALRTPGAALDLAIRAAMLERKEVYLSLGIDAGTFSKILDNKAAFPGELIKDFCELVNNRIYVEWITSRIGCTAVMVKTEAERIAEKALAENRILRDVIHSFGRAAT